MNDQSNTNTSLDKQNELPEKEKGEDGILGINVTESHEMTEIQKEEQERTRLMKDNAIREFPNCRGIVKLTCAKIGIVPRTFFRWMREDPIFKQAVKECKVDVNDEIKDVMLKKILIDEDGPMIRYYLDRKDPEFIPRAKTEIITGDRTLEDLLDEDEDELNDKPTDTTKQEEDKKGPEVPIGEVVFNKEQEGGVSKVQIQQSPAVLLEKENEKKPDSESKTKGNIESDRRRPIARLHEERN